MPILIGSDITLLNRARTQINAEIETRKDSIAEGILDQSRYLKQAGEIQGMRAALGIMENLARDILGQDRPEG